MKCPHHLILAAVMALLMGHFASTVAHADILGFGNFSGFTINVDDSGSGPTVSSGAIHLMTGASENRNIFYDTPQNITDFTASFIYEATGTASNGAGTSFILQNSPSGASTIPNGANDSFGYAGFPGKSVGVTLEMVSDASGYYTNGNYGGGSSSVNPINLLSGDPINVSLTYNGSTLQESLFDTTTQASWNSQPYLVTTPFPTLLGGSTAYVGLAATTGFVQNQSFSNFLFTTSPVPEPSTFALFGVGAIGLLAWVWQRARISW